MLILGYDEASAATDLQAVSPIAWCSSSHTERCQRRTHVLLWIRHQPGSAAYLAHLGDHKAGHHALSTASESPSITSLSNDRNYQKTFSGHQPRGKEIWPSEKVEFRWVHISRVSL